MKIAIDIDGVLLDIMVTYCKIFNSKYETNYEKEDVTDWEFFREWQISEKDAFEIFYQIYKDSMPVPFIDNDAPKVMQKLRACHDVYIVTARNPEYKAPIVKKLNYHNVRKGVNYEDIVLLHHKPYDIKLSLDFDLYIDDNPNLAKSMNGEPERKLLLYDQPWNRNIILHDNVLRIYSWKDVEKELGCKTQN